MQFPVPNNRLRVIRKRSRRWRGHAWSKPAREWITARRLWPAFDRPVPAKEALATRSPLQHLPTRTGVPTQLPEYPVQTEADGSGQRIDWLASTQLRYRQPQAAAAAPR